MIDCVLSVDIGTTSLKAGFISADGEVVSFYRQPFSLFTGRFVALCWKKALKKAIKKMYRQCVAQKVNIKAVVVSGNGPTVVSKSGRTLLWNENVDYNLLGISGYQYGTSLFLPRIMAFKECFPSDYAGSDLIFSGPEYFIYELCDSAVTILPEQRFIAAYWDKTFTDENGYIRECGIEAKKLPDFVSPGSVCGKLKASVASELQLSENIPVVAGGPDFVVALIGTNTLSAGKLCDRSGSSEGFNLCSKKLVIADGVRSLPSVIPGLWNLSVLIPNSGKLNEDERLKACRNAVDLLRTVAGENEIEFGEGVVATGGQTKSEKYMAKKTLALDVPLSVCQLSDAELLGDACLGWFALGKYESLKDAAASIVRETVTYGNI